MTDYPPQVLRDLVASYAVGALESDEAAIVDSLLREGNPPWLAEFRSLEPVMLELLYGVKPQNPDPKVRKTLLDRIAERESLARRAKGEVFVNRDQEAAWLESGVPGVRVRTLFVDRQRGRQTFLLRAAPGATLPPHLHHADEECYILEGSLTTLGHVFRAGDYLRFAAGTVHDETHTSAGCLILLTSALVEAGGMETAT